MNYQFASTYSLIIIMYLLALFLFLRQEKDNRARLFLAIAFVLFGTLMLFQFIYTYVWNKVGLLDFSMLRILCTTIICPTTLIYSLEILYPKSVTQKKVFKFYIPLIILHGVYLAAFLNGYKFQNYTSITHLFSNLSRFDAIVYLPLLIYIGTFIVYIIYTVIVLSTNKNEQINPRWFKKYLITYFVIGFFYLVSIVSNAGLHMISKYIFILCCGYITYLELYERVCVEHVFPKTYSEDQLSKTKETLSHRETKLRAELIEYMDQEKAWRDPDITVKDVTTRLRINRRVLNSVVQEMGYDNFPSYVNYLRVKEFTEIIENSKDDSFQNIFFNVGFKSRATAHRNFKNIKGLSPSEYYQSIQKVCQN